MLDIEDLNSLKHSLYRDGGKGKIELADKIDLLILKEENKEELINEIKKKYSKGYNYLDIAKYYRDSGNVVIINEDFFVAYIKDFLVLFQHSTFEVYNLV
jgi:hypothetical protein